MLNALVTKEVQDPYALEAYFLQALYWSVGAGLLEDGRVKFDNYVKYLASMTIIQDESVDAGLGSSLQTIRLYSFCKQLHLCVSNRSFIVLTKTSLMFLKGYITPMFQIDSSFKKKKFKDPICTIMVFKRWVWICVWLWL